MTKGQEVIDFHFWSCLHQRSAVRQAGADPGVSVKGCKSANQKFGLWGPDYNMSPNPLQNFFCQRSALVSPLSVTASTGATLQATEDLLQKNTTPKHIWCGLWTWNLLWGNLESRGRDPKCQNEFVSARKQKRAKHTWVFAKFVNTRQSKRKLWEIGSRWLGAWNCPGSVIKHQRKTWVGDACIFNDCSRVRALRFQMSSVPKMFLLHD